MNRNAFMNPPQLDKKPNKIDGKGYKPHPDHDNGGLAKPKRERTHKHTPHGLAVLDGCKFMRTRHKSTDSVHGAAIAAFINMSHCVLPTRFRLDDSYNVHI